MSEKGFTQGSVRNMVIETDWLNKLVDRGENKGYIIQADQVRYVNCGTAVALNRFFFYGTTAPRGSGHLDTTQGTPHSVGFLWRSGQHE